LHVGAKRLLNRGVSESVMTDITLDDGLALDDADGYGCNFVLLVKTGRAYYTTMGG
jgi:hypothetical protein